MLSVWSRKLPVKCPPQRGEAKGPGLVLDLPGDLEEGRESIRQDSVQLYGRFYEVTMTEITESKPPAPPLARNKCCLARSGREQVRREETSTLEFQRWAIGKEPGTGQEMKASAKVRSLKCLPKAQSSFFNTIYL